MSSNQSHYEVENGTVDSNKNRNSSKRSDLPFCKNFLSEWIYGLALVEFDLDIGPVLVKSYPFDSVSLAQYFDISTICFSALPDSKILLSDSCDYIFRLPFKSSADYESQCLLAYVAFRQFSDPSSRRGCQQKSIVLLSPFGYSSLFLKLATTFADHAFRGEHELDTLFEVIGRNILSWPLPQIGQYYELPFLGSLVTAFLTGENGRPTKAIHISTSDLPLCQKDSRLLHYYGKPDLSVLLKSHGKYLWHIWELALMNEPIMVFSSRPDDCSSCIFSIVDLIAPIRFAADHRPYFTLQDSDLKMVLSSIKLHRSSGSLKLGPSTDLTIPCRHGMLVGVTNPFFIKDQEPWPNVLKLGPTRHHTVAIVNPVLTATVATASNNGTSHTNSTLASNNNSSCSISSSNGNGNGNGNSGPVPSSTFANTLQKFLQLTPSTAVGMASNSSSSSGYTQVATTSPQGSRAESPLPTLSSVRLFELDELFKCERRRSIAKDPKMLVLITQLSESQEESTPSQEMIIWRHFEELTERFMAPFYSFFQTLLPPIQSLKSVENRLEIPSRPLVKPFHKSPFLSFLSERGTPLRFRNRMEDSDRHAFYESFLATLNFDIWLQSQTLATQNALNAQYYLALAHLDLQAWYMAQPRPEAEVTQVLRVFRKALEEATLFKEDNETQPEESNVKKNENDMLLLLEQQIEKLLALIST